MGTGGSGRGWWFALCACAATACVAEPSTHESRSGDGSSTVAPAAPVQETQTAHVDAGMSPPVAPPPSAMDASISPQHDAGIDLSDAAPLTVQFAEWLAFDYIQCRCNSAPAVAIEMCLDLADTYGETQDMICQPICATKGGLNATGAVEDSALCDVPHVDGPDSLACHCMDGYVESFCADLSCWDVSQRQNLCAPFCAAHGGVASIDCQDFDYDRCIPKGHNHRVCECPGKKVSYCIALDCQEGQFAGESCRQACDGRDALVESCLPDNVACP